jgi:hypothetical protein
MSRVGESERNRSSRCAGMRKKKPYSHRDALLCDFPNVTVSTSPRSVQSNMRGAEKRHTRQTQAPHSRSLTAAQRAQSRFRKLKTLTRHDESERERERRERETDTGTHARLLVRVNAQRKGPEEHTWCIVQPVCPPTRHATRTERLTRDHTRRTSTSSLSYHSESESHAGEPRSGAHTQTLKYMQSSAE